MAEFCRARGARATLVFDGAPFRPELGGQQLGGVTVRFPPQGKDADSVIREIVDAARRPNELTVVTSDKAVYSYAKTRGASAMRSQEWTALSRKPGASPRARARRSESREKPDHEPDIEGWLERFNRR